jgi:hypothetical protein
MMTRTIRQVMPGRPESACVAASERLLLDRFNVALRQEGMVGSAAAANGGVKISTRVGMARTLGGFIAGLAYDCSKSAVGLHGYHEAGECAKLDQPATDIGVKDGRITALAPQERGFK